jgi:hypothetical protein
MKVILLQRKDDVGFDEYDGFVIIASSTQFARKMASDLAADEGADIWLDKTKCTATIIGEAKSSDRQYVVLDSFNAG